MYFQDFVMEYFMEATWFSAWNIGQRGQRLWSLFPVLLSAHCSIFKARWLGWSFPRADSHVACFNWDSKDLDFLGMVSIHNSHWLQLQISKESKGVRCSNPSDSHILLPSVLLTIPAFSWTYWCLTLLKDHGWHPKLRFSVLEVTFGS